MATWEKTALEVQKHRDESIKVFESDLKEIPKGLSGRLISVPKRYLSRKEVTITESPPTELLTALSAGKLTAVEVVKAFLKRAAIAQKLVNCIYELLPDRAIARAKELDEAFLKSGSPTGPLHGLPFSAKEHIGVKDLDHNSAFVGWVGRKSPDDAAIIRILEGSGAVLFARTTESQGLITQETSNNITGITTNPHNTSLTSGGSSGGESALQALFGSPLGVGSDIAGSIRSPAASCGLYGFKPTASRLPIVGVTAFNIGCETIYGTLGPISRTLDGIETFMRAILACEPWNFDPSLHQVPWRTVQFVSLPQETKLTVGVIWDDGVVKPSPPIARGLSEVVARLKMTTDIKVIEWKAYEPEKAMKLLMQGILCDGAKAISDVIESSGEPWTPMAEYAAKGFGEVKPLNLHELWAWTVEREMFRYFYLNEWQTKAPSMDVILSPASPHPASPFETSRYWGYYSIWNLLDMPAIVFPVTKVDVDLDTKDPKYQPRSDLDQWYYDHYNANEQVNVPVCLQLAAKKLEDERLVAALQLIKERIGLPFVDCLVG